jgi:hypothetical protein
LSAPGEIHDGQIHRLDVQPIGHHQLDLRLVAGRNHLTTLLDRHSQWLLTQHVCRRAISRRFVRSPLTMAASVEFRLACANAGMTATWAI